MNWPQKDVKRRKSTNADIFTPKWRWRGEITICNLHFFPLSDWGEIIKFIFTVIIIWLMWRLVVTDHLVNLQQYMTK